MTQAQHFPLFSQVVFGQAHSFTFSHRIMETFLRLPAKPD
jgi:hypothetical protein